MTTVRSCAIAAGVVIGDGLLLLLLYGQYRTVREVRELLTQFTNRAPQGDQPAHSSVPPQDMPPPKPAPASARPQPTAHSTSLLKSLLNGSTLSSVVDLCKYKSEVGNLGSIDTELQRLQDDLPVRPSKQSEEDMEVVPELLSKAPMEGLVDK